MTTQTTDQLVIELAEQNRSRFYGKYRGIVTDVDDPEGMGRLRALVLQRWDSEGLSERIRLSQKRRRLVLASDLEGIRPRWNHGEEPGSDVVWYRGETSYNDWAFQYLPVTD